MASEIFDGRLGTTKAKIRNQLRRERLHKSSKVASKPSREVAMKRAERMILDNESDVLKLSEMLQHEKQTLQQYSA